MTLVRCDNISIEFGDLPILRDASLGIEDKERVALIGRNGAGKSTLLKILAGWITPDQGEVLYKRNLRISILDQQLPGELHRSCFEVVREGLAHQQSLIDEYERLASTGSTDEPHLRELQSLQGQIESAGGWQPDVQVERIISQLDLPPNSRLSDLSGGWQRRVALGKALVSNPELLLLDEPTNHLDIATIEWLEGRIRSYPGSVVFVTHDRNFLDRLCTRIVEVDRGKLIDWPGNYRGYLALKEQSEQDEDTTNALFDKRLAQEEAWIRQGVKARRTRNEGRVRALEDMRNEHADRIKRQGRVRIQIESADTAGRRVIEVRNVTHGFAGEPLIEGFSLRVMRGDRIGLIGNNGVGKSTLLKIILGEIEPDQGSIKLSPHLQIGYFDQMRRELDLEKTVAENVGNGKEYITLNGKERHIVGYLRNFLFTAKRAMTPVRYLSGGECNRVLLAKLFSQASNLLVLDEPTNDLDVEMLEVLEAQLVEYDGTLIIVSHDRTFLDNVCTSVLVFEENQHLVQYGGGYSDWALRGKKLMETDRPTGKKPAVAVQSDRASPTSAPRKAVKLSYKLQRELDQLPEKIDALEKQIEALVAQTGQPGFYDQPFEKTQPLLDQLTAVQARLTASEARWAELEAMTQ